MIRFVRISAYVLQGLVLGTLLAITIIKLLETAGGESLFWYQEF